MRLVKLLIAALLAADLLAQTCNRPIPPAAGFVIQLDPIVPVTYSDGYQTFGSLYWPIESPPNCGWPLVVFVHPLGQSRADELALQMEVAAQGYAVWSYDVRAQGQALAANPGHPQAGSTLWGAVERCDLGEQILFVGGNPQWAGTIDGARVAVVGASQGGVHAWNAAAWSGRPLAVPGRAQIVFPVVKCVAANDYVAEPIRDWLRDDVLWSSWFIEAIAGSYSTIPMDPGFLQAARTAFENQDPQSLLTTFANEGRGIVANLLTSTVPVLYSHAYHDLIDSPMSSLQLMQNMVAPRRVMMSTIGHTSVRNLHERAFRDAVMMSWLHRFLWGEQNEVDLETPFVMSELPLLRPVREDIQHAWNRSHRTDPLQSATATRYFLHDDLALREVVPMAPQVAASVAQVIDPQATTFTPADYLNQGSMRNPGNVLAVCPLSEVVYSVIVPEERQLDASAVVHLRLVPDSADWMLAALLTVTPPGAGSEEVMLSSAAVCSTTSVQGVAEDREFSLPPVAVRVPAGATVRLRLRNLWLRESPMIRILEVAPRFHDFRVDIEHGDATTGSWIDLPLQPVRPKLVATTTWFPLATAPRVELSVRGGEARAGRTYFVSASVGGHLPPTLFLNDVLPIQSDWMYGIVSTCVFLPEFTGFLGVLDAAGEATAVMDLSAYAPLPAELTGLRLSYAAFVFDDFVFATGAATNACDVFLR